MKPSRGGRSIYAASGPAGGGNAPQRVANGTLSTVNGPRIPQSAAKRPPPTGAAGRSAAPGPSAAPSCPLKPSRSHAVGGDAKAEPVIKNFAKMLGDER